MIGMNDRHQYLIAGHIGHCNMSYDVSCKPKSCELRVMSCITGLQSKIESWLLFYYNWSCAWGKSVFFNHSWVNCAFSADLCQLHLFRNSCNYFFTILKYYTIYCDQAFYIVLKSHSPQHCIAFMFVKKILAIMTTFLILAYLLYYWTRTIEGLNNICPNRIWYWSQTDCITILILQMTRALLDNWPMSCYRRS